MWLRQDLYYRLRRRPEFGGVIVANQGEAMLANVRKVNGRPRLDVAYRGEAYRVNCIFCNDTRHRLWINHLWGYLHPDTGTRNLWLAICYNQDCLDTYERQRALYNHVYEDSHPATNEPVNYGEIDMSFPEAVDWPGDVTPLAELSPSHHAVAYLHERGYDPAFLSDVLDVRYCSRSRHAMAYDRIVIPLFMRGEMRMWQARYIGTPPGRHVGKYFTTPGAKKSKMLYNYDVASRYSYVVLVEGPTDVWRFGPEAVALLGKDLSRIQRQLVLSTWRRAVVMLDTDDADAASHAQGIYDSLVGARRSPVDFGVAVATLPAGHDPGDLPTGLIRDAAFTAASRAGLYTR